MHLDDWVEKELERSPELGLTDAERPPTASLAIPLTVTEQESLTALESELRPEPVFYFHVMNEQFVTPNGVFHLDRIDADRWSIYSVESQTYVPKTGKELLVPPPQGSFSQQKSYWDNHGFTLLEAMERLSIEVKPKRKFRKMTLQVLRTQISLESEYRQANEDVAYISSPDWAQGKYVVTNDDLQFMGSDGCPSRSSTLEDDISWYLFKRKKALEEAKSWVLHMRTMRCVSCSMNTDSEYYMVEDHLWIRSGLGANEGMLCIGCLESRIGQQLTWQDFTDAPINWSIRASSHKSERLISRLRNGDGLSRTDLVSGY